VWFNADPGTREEVILVVDTPPIEVPTVTEDAPKTTAVRRRDELADFLTKRRAALTPEEVGLPNGTRRRTPGLRREEVALLAGVGTTWYTWLEQGRDVRASLDVLEAIAAALRMTPAERGHLIALGRREDPPPCPRRAEFASSAMRNLIENLGNNPAYLLGRRWDYLTWNRAASLMLGGLDELEENERNHLWQTFTDPRRRELFSDWNESSRLMAAKFRADFAHNIGDPSWDELKTSLRKSSKEFCEAWKRHEVADLGEGRKVLNHPLVGRLVFEHAVLRPQSNPEQRLILFSPLPEDDTPAKLAELLAAH
jgi:transcriptional regulator with XRE-family HTH domain